MNWLKKATESRSVPGRRLWTGTMDGKWTEVLSGEGLPYHHWSILEQSRYLSVDGATEYSPHFRKALKEIADQYNLHGMTIKFDGNPTTVDKVLEMGELDFDNLVFLHGTSVAAYVNHIRQNGLQPRDKTGVESGYGAKYNAPSGNAGLIYLTTQAAMARFAAHDAAQRDKSAGLVLKVSGLLPTYMEPDEDSKEGTAIDSLYRMGSIGYRRPIPPQRIEPYIIWDKSLVEPGKRTGWRPVQPGDF